MSPVPRPNTRRRTDHQLCFLPATDEYVDPVLWFREVFETWCSHLAEFMAAELKIGEEAY